MARFSEDQILSAREGEAETPGRADGVFATPDARKRTLGRLAAAALIAVLGLGAGWLVGKAVSGAFIYSPAVNGGPAGDVSASSKQLQSEHQPSASEHSAASSQGQGALQPPLAESERRPERPRDDEGALPGIPSYDQSTREIGRKALEKIVKESEKAKRGEHRGKNKDEREDER